MQVFSNFNNPISVDHKLFGRERREAIRNSEMSVGDSRHTREMLASDMPHLNATVHLSISGLAGYFKQQLGNYVTNEQMHEFFTSGSGMTGVMDNFEKIHARILENYDGIEMARRLEGLERAFYEMAHSFANIVANNIIQLSGIDMSDANEMTGSENSDVRKTWNKMRDISTSIVDMFQSGLDFFRLNGTFAGFSNTASANRPGMLSFQDFNLLSNASRNLSDGFTSDVTALPLSNSGRALLNGIIQRDFL